MRLLIEALNARFAAVSTGRNVLLVLLASVLVQLLFGAWLVPAFQAATNGMYPIDMSFPTTPAVIYNEYAAYTAESRRIYRWFFLVDFVWPPLLATLFAMTWTWLSKRSPARSAKRMLAAGILLLPFAAALLDLLENVGFLVLLENYPRKLIAVAWATGIVKHTKLVLLLLCALVTLMLAGSAATSAVAFSRRE